MKSLFIVSSFLLVLLFCSTIQAQQSSYPGTNIGIEFWKLAQISYCSASDLQSWNTSCSYISDFGGMESLTVITGGSNQAFTAYYPTDNQIYVVFRGSSNLPNWIEDLNTFYSQYDYSLCSGCKVHSGFNDAYTSLASGVKNNVAALTQQYPNAGLSVIGHSLGGAEATLAVADLINQGYSINYFMTFGSPRVGNPAFSNWFDGSMNLGTYSARVVHYKDIVPHLPPMSFGFQHIDTEIWYTSDSNNDFQICTQNEDPNCSIQYNLLECSTKDHTSYFNLNDAMLSIPPIIIDGSTINSVQM